MTERETGKRKEVTERDREKERVTERETGRRKE